MLDLREILAGAKTIAIVGCSPRPTRTSHRIARYLQDVGYTIVPVNPYHDELLGVPCYRDVQHIPHDVQIDIANIYRRPQYTAQMVQDVIERMATSGDRPVIWTQLGVSSSEAEALAAEAELPYVRNRCILVEHGRLMPA